MTEEEIIGRGRRARLLLESPEFISSMNHASSDLIEEICQSRPEDRDKREVAYFRIRGLRDIHATLQNYITAASVIEVRQELDQEEE